MVAHLGFSFKLFSIPWHFLLATTNSQPPPPEGRLRHLLVAGWVPLPGTRTLVLAKSETWRWWCLHGAWCCLCSKVIESWDLCFSCLYPSYHSVFLLLSEADMSLPSCTAWPSDQCKHHDFSTCTHFISTGCCCNTCNTHDVTVGFQPTVCSMIRDFVFHWNNFKAFSSLAHLYSLHQWSAECREKMGEWKKQTSSWQMLTTVPV